MTAFFRTNALRSAPVYLPWKSIKNLRIRGNGSTRPWPSVSVRLGGISPFLQTLFIRHNQVSYWYRHQDKDELLKGHTMKAAFMNAAESEIKIPLRAAKQPLHIQQTPGEGIEPDQEPRLDYAMYVCAACIVNPTTM